MNNNNKSNQNLNKQFEIECNQVFFHFCYYSFFSWVVFLLLHLWWNYVCYKFNRATYYLLDFF